MKRTLLTLLLLVPLSLNGLWLVCADSATGDSEPAVPATEVAKAVPECTGSAMCPLHTQASDKPTEAAAQPGAICLISPDGKSSSLAAVGFIYAPPACAVSISFAEIVTFETSEYVSATYADAFISNATPPPRA